MDLDLWGNEALIRRQNQLKYQFWTLLGRVGDEFSQNFLSSIHPESKGKKLAQGQDLGGLPYQVLDIIRDFDFNNGLNIRLLNWFGKGVFLFVLAGNERYTDFDFSSLGLTPTYTEGPFDYEEIIDEKQNPSQKNASPKYQQGFQRLPLSSSMEKNFQNWTQSIKTILEVLRSDEAKSVK
ncbi:hypothetical protein [Algoriphagus limi]|uniref:Uncharacterized protein n=1 Tax=Algoriphagus limi TaxID=2975273 RepID=A0ABT2G3V9_9BACT|nr:hypothetical protein [Algoriphagus limi]MCS5489949.1 hypothetical protein [Algoriphagus limi]